MGDTESIAGQLHIVMHVTYGEWRGLVIRGDFWA